MKAYIYMYMSVAVVAGLLYGSIAMADEIPEFCKTPILFVHGYFAGPDMTWGILLNRMKNDGCPEEYLYAPEFDDRTGCNPDHGLQVRRWVRTLIERTGFSKINIIAHSMGALDTRYYIKYLCGYRRIKNVVMIGGANHGTFVACSEPISCGADSMCRGMSDDAWQDNDFLVMINSCDETPGNDVLYTSIWSGFDEIIRPPSSSVVSGAWNVKLHTPLVGHWSVIQVGETYDYIKRGLTGEGKNTTVEPDDAQCVTWCPPVDDEQETEDEAELNTEDETELGLEVETEEGFELDGGDADLAFDSDVAESDFDDEDDAFSSSDGEALDDACECDVAEESVDDVDLSDPDYDGAGDGEETVADFDKEFSEIESMVESASEESASDSNNEVYVEQNRSNSGASSSGCAGGMGGGVFAFVLLLLYIKRGNYRKMI